MLYKDREIGSAPIPRKNRTASGEPWKCYYFDFRDFKELHVGDDGVAVTVPGGRTTPANFPTNDLVEGREYVFMCFADGEQKIHGPRDGYLVVRYDPNRPAAPLDLVDPEFALLRLVSEVKITPEPPAWRLSPAPPIEQLVGLPTWFWVDVGSQWRTKVGYTAPVGGVVATVTATAKPRRALEFRPGDGGKPVFCDAPGAAYTGVEDDGNPCQHIYTSGSGPAGFKGQMIIHYSVAWAAPGYDGGDLPDIESLPADITVLVKGTQAVDRNPPR